MKTLVAIRLSETKVALKVSVYEVTRDGGFDPLWGRATEKNGRWKLSDGFPCMVFDQGINGLPPFYFKLQGTSSDSAMSDLAKKLAKHFSEPVMLTYLKGFEPSVFVSGVSKSAADPRRLRAQFPALQTAYENLVEAQEQYEVMLAMCASAGAIGKET